jgi:fumarate reductase flavoprotein subunit
MARWIQQQQKFAPADEEAIAQSIAQHEQPFQQQGQGLEEIRERLYATMWERVGILRSSTDLQRAQAELQTLSQGLYAVGLAQADRAFNLSWHDWLNLRNLIDVSRVIAAAALAREDSRGAHYREDFPETRHLEQSAFTTIRARGDHLDLQWTPVKFTRVKPGETILQDEPAAA